MDIPWNWDIPLIIGFISKAAAKPELILVGLSWDMPMKLEVYSWENQLSCGFNRYTLW